MPRDYSLDKNPPSAFQRLPENTRDDDWIRALLHRGRIARIASRWDLQPFVNTTTFLYDEPNARIIFHSNVAGRVRANLDSYPEVCVEVSEFGHLLPSNVALEFSLQYRSALVFGKARIIADDDKKREVLHKLVAKYFGKMELGKDYRPATEKELRSTSVYEIAIESWSGKENWKDRTDQSDEWPALDEKWFEEYK